MSGTDGGNADQKSCGGTYEDTVLEFLDKEISSAAMTKEKLRPQHNDLDTLMRSLLDESIVASEAMEAGRDAGNEDLDKLFAHIFKESREDAPAAFAVAPQEAETSPPSAILPEAGLNQAEENLLATEDAAGQETVEAGTSMPDVPVPLAAAEVAKINPPASETFAQSESQPEEAMPASPAALEETADTLVFSLPPSRPAWNLRMALIGGAFLCLLAGTGIVYYASSNKTAAGPSDIHAAAVPSPAIAPETAIPITVPEPKAAIRNTVEGNGAGTPNRTAVAASVPEMGKANPAAKRVDTPAASVPVPASPSKAAPDAPAAVIEKPATAAAPPPETILPSQPARAAAPPPAAPPVNNDEPQPAVPAGKTAISMEEMPPAPKAATPVPVTPARSLPRKVVPPEVLTRVTPKYPELARRSRTTGTVLVDTQIDENGKVVKATALSGPTLFHAEAVNAVLLWRFRPASIDGTPISSSTQVSIVFK
jgi:protein TonB